VSYEPDSPVVPDGLAIRRRRRRRGWSRRGLVAAIAAAAERETGVAETISLNLLQGIEEKGEVIPYAKLCRVAAGLDCDPVDLVRSPGR